MSAVTRLDALHYPGFAKANIGVQSNVFPAPLPLVLVLSKRKLKASPLRSVTLVLQGGAAHGVLVLVPESLNSSPETTAGIPSLLRLHFLTHTLPPTLLNPLNLNPLEDQLLTVIDFERLNHPPGTSALPQRNQNPDRQDQGFPDPHIMVDAVLASACLPLFFSGSKLMESTIGTTVIPDTLRSFR